MQRKSIVLGAEPLHYAEFGDGAPEKPVALLVHGLGGSHVNWFGVGPELAKTHRTYAIDLPGFGLSPRPSTGTNVPSMLLAIDRFASAMSPNAPVRLFGNSMGGALSILYAADNPGRVASLVLACPALPHPRGVFPDRGFLALLLIAAAPFGAKLFGARARKATPEALVYEMLKLTCVDRKRVSKALIEEAIALARTRAERPWMDQAFSEATRSIGSRVLVRPGAFFDSMRKVRCPALIVHGAKDRLIDVRAARYAVGKCPQFDLTVLDDIGHTPQLEAPDQFLGAIEKWRASRDKSLAA